MRHFLLPHPAPRLSPAPRARRMRAATARAVLVTSPGIAHALVPGTGRTSRAVAIAAVAVSADEQLLPAAHAQVHAPGKL